MEKNYLDIKIKKLWYVCYTSLLLLILVFFVIPQFIEGFILPLTIIGIVVCGGLGTFFFWLIGAMYKNYTYSYKEDRIQINRGVIFKHEIVIPVCQIQDLHLNQGPIMQILKLQSLEISTAGSNYKIDGLDKEVAKNIVLELETYLKTRIEALSNEEI